MGHRIQIAPWTKMFWTPQMAHQLWNSEIKSHTNPWKHDGGGAFWTIVERWTWMDVDGRMGGWMEGWMRGWAVYWEWQHISGVLRNKTWTILNSASFFIYFVTLEKYWRCENTYILAKCYVWWNVTALYTIGLIWTEFIVPFEIMVAYIRIYITSRSSIKHFRWKVIIPPRVTERIMHFLGGGEF